MDNGERDIRDRDIEERDIRERDIGERDIKDTVAACRFDQQLLINIHLRGISGRLRLSQSWHHQARFFAPSPAANAPAQ